MHHASREANARYELGLDFVGQERWGEAIHAFQAALRYDDQHVLALNMLAQVLARLGQRDEALVAYRRLAELYPGVAQAHGELGEYLAGIGRHEEAVASLRRASSLAPNNVGFLFALGEQYHALGRDSGAVECYRKVIALDPKHFEAYAGLGSALSNLGSLREAEKAIRDSLAVEPDYGWGWYLLAGILAETEGEAAARPSLERATQALQNQVARQPGNALALCVLGATLAGLGRYEEAATSFEKGLRIQPDCLEQLPGLGAVFLAVRQQAGLEGES